MGEFPEPTPERGHNKRVIFSEENETTDSIEIKAGQPIIPELKTVLNQILSQANGPEDFRAMHREVGPRWLEISRSKAAEGPYAGQTKTALWLEELEDPKLRMYGNVVGDSVHAWTIRYWDNEHQAESILEGPAPENQKRAAELLARYAQSLGIPLEIKLPD